MMSRPTHRDAYQAFRWEESARAMGFTPGEPVNLGRAIVDRHAGSDHPALRWFGKRGAARVYTFDELARLTDRFANVLRARGIGPGDRVAGFLPRIPEMLIAMIGTWKAGGVYVPIFTGFGPDAIEFRVRHSGARVLCTQWEPRARLPAPFPDGVEIITVAGEGEVAPPDTDFWRAMREQPEETELAARRRDEPAVLLYTSGSTGPPKGVRIATNFLVAIHPHLVHGADLRPDDVFWPTGDPGWGYGLVCYMGALALGVPVLSHEAAPTPERCLAWLRERGVTNLATTPTLLRGVMALGPAAAGPLRLRGASSCGEPLNAEVVRFFRERWGVTVRDQYGSSEFGLPIGNLATMEMPVKPGSMGLPLPGCTMAVVDDAG
ncbi:MAG: acyl-CoA synthetase, partial [Candidatus Rokuibacteriota bacterium]